MREGSQRCARWEQHASGALIVAVPWEIVRDICTTRQLNEKLMRAILLIILILLLIAALPTWPYSTGWGYYPSGGLGLILVIILLVVLLR